MKNYEYNFPRTFTQFDDYANFSYRFAARAYGIRLDTAIFDAGMNKFGILEETPRIGMVGSTNKEIQK